MTPTPRPAEPRWDELERLAREATPGPWKPDVMYVVAEIPRGRPGGEVIIEAGATAASHRDRDRDTRNAAYLAAASPDVVLALIAELRAIRAESSAEALDVERLLRDWAAAFERVNGRLGTFGQDDITRLQAASVALRAALRDDDAPEREASDGH